MRIVSDKNFLYFDQCNPLEKNRLLNQHNAVKVKAGYRLPLNIWCLREVWKSFPDIRKDVEKIANSSAKDVEYLLGIKNIASHVEPHDNLRKYQAEDSFYLKHVEKAGVFNEQRTGKTPTIIQTIKSLSPKKVLIVTPASLVYNWQREFEKWFPETQTHVVKDNKATTYYGGIVIISKDRLKSSMHWQSQQYDMAIVDEAHFLRNYKTAQSKAVFKIQADRKYALTGTPTVKHPADIFGILHFLYPIKFPSYWQFAERYFEVNENYMGHNEVGKPKKNRIEELQQMIGIISVQRKRKEVMNWLPDKERTTFYCQMDKKQKKAYDDMLKYFMVEHTDVDASSVLTQLIRLRQICTEPNLLGIGVEGAKTKSLIDYLKESPNEPFVIMSMFTSYLKLLQIKLEKEGFKVGMIHGEMTNKQKSQSAQNFQNGQVDILLCNIISAGTGFTLDRAETIIFMDKAWNPAENEQAEDRITPTTKEKVHKHHIISFVAQNTVDEKINDILEQKKSLTDIVNEGGLQAIKKLLLQ
jgi:SNF2 family DNA or RNA helicase